MQNQSILAGIDIGTGGCKVTLIDTECNFIAEGYSDYVTHHPYTGWAEQDPTDWFPAFLNSLNTALQKGCVKSSQIIGLSTDASAHNLVLLDKNDKVLRRTIMWMDQRSYKEAAYMMEHHKDEIFRIGYQMPSPTWSMLQLMWIKNNEPEVFSRISRVMFIKDYVRYLLTGAWTTDHIEAQGSLLFDNINWCWSKELCEISGIPIEIFPPLVKPTDVVGYISAEASRITGIPQGVPVVNGATDTALESYCVGAVEENCCVSKLATSGTLQIFLRKPIPNPKAFTYSHVVDGLWYTSLGTSSAAESLRWYRNVFCATDAKIEKEHGRDIYKLLDEEAEAIPVNSEGLLFHPYLMGERSPYWDAKLRGSFVGATARHTRGHFTRALLEGVAFSIKDNFSIIETKEDIKEIRIVGGGGRSPLWRSIMANVLNRPILKFETDDSSYGCAMLAGVGIGVFKNHQEAIKKGVHLKERLLPNQETAQLYQKQFEIYKEIHDALEGIYRKM